MTEINPRLAIWLEQFCSWHRPKPLGLLEQRVLAALWEHGAMTVREMRLYVPRLAYTTLMTTLDRLSKKGLLQRERRGYAHVYTPALSRGELHAAMADRVLKALL